MGTRARDRLSRLQRSESAASAREATKNALVMPSAERVAGLAAHPHGRSRLEGLVAPAAWPWRVGELPCLSRRPVLLDCRPAARVLLLTILPAGRATFILLLCRFGADVAPTLRSQAFSSLLLALHRGLRHRPTRRRPGRPARAPIPGPTWGGFRLRGLERSQRSPWVVMRIGARIVRVCHHDGLEHVDQLLQRPTAQVLHQYTPL